MRALVYNGELRYSDRYPVPEPGDGEALVKIRRAGVCRTDLEIVRGYMDFAGVPGHEFAGVVEQAPLEEVVGRRVTGEINLTCGKCSFCLRNRHSHCTERSVLGILNRDGVFAEYVTLPVKNLHLIPDSVSDEEAVFVEPLAASIEILEQVHIRPHDDVCVLGDGMMGLLVGQVLSGTSCGLTVFGKHEKKLSVLRSFGIRTDHVSVAPEKSFDFVIDCTGSLTGVDTALKVVRPRGTVVVKTTVAEKRLPDLNSMVINEVTLVGSRCGSFPPAIRMLGQGRVDVQSLVSGVFKLEDGLRALEYAAGKDVLKVLITPE
jgi:threonine dehydrogenase-like Zn-dependent dehydrogenase